MSKNKTIQEFHQITGLPYSECRRALKKAHWDICEALLPKYYIDFDALAEAIRKAGEAVKKLSENIHEAIASTINRLASLDTEDLIEALREHKEDNINERGTEEEA